MNKYSDWSDHKVNMLATDRDSWRNKKYIGYSLNDSPIKILRTDEAADYCNDARLMKSLMQKYKIGLIPIGDIWLASPDVFTAMNNDLIPQAQSDNPCRAIAECFLFDWI